MDSVAFITHPLVAPFVQCHYCETDADVTVEKDDVRVAVCEAHFREQMDALADSDLVEELDEQLDIDRTE